MPRKAKPGIYNAADVSKWLERAGIRTARSAFVHAAAANSASMMT